MYLSQLIVPYNPTRNLRSASKHLLEVPNVRLKSYGDRAFSVAAPKHWNDIPLDIKLSGSVDVFKSRLKTYLFRLAFNWLFVLVLLLVSYFLFLIVKRYRAFVYTAIQKNLLLLLLLLSLLLLLKRMANCWPWPISRSQQGWSKFLWYLFWSPLLFQVRWCAVVVGGDFNLVLDVEKGKKNGIARTHQTALEADAMENMELCDVWRIFNPDCKRCIWRQRQPEIHCRLDFFLVSQSILGISTYTDITPGFRTDHSLITLRLSLHSNPRGNGFWKLNTSLRLYYCGIW